MNKALTEKYDKLVAQAPDLIKVLPWGKEFEVDVFRKPDFTGMGVSEGNRGLTITDGCR